MSNWHTRMLLVLMAWCFTLAVWNGVQQWHLTELQRHISSLKRDLCGTQDALFITQQVLGRMQTNIIERLDAQLKEAAQ